MKRAKTIQDNSHLSLKMNKNRTLAVLDINHDFGIGERALKVLIKNEY